MVFPFAGIGVRGRAVYRETRPGDRLRLRRVSGVNVDWDDGTVWRSRGPDVSQMRWYRLRTSVVKMMPSVW